MQQGTIKRNLTIITIALLNFLICTVIVNKASGADGIKIFANGKLKKYSTPMPTRKTAPGIQTSTP